MNSCTVHPACWWFLISLHVSTHKRSRIHTYRQTYMPTYTHSHQFENHLQVQRDLKRTFPPKNSELKYLSKIYFPHYIGGECEKNNKKYTTVVTLLSQHCVFKHVKRVLIKSWFCLVLYYKANPFSWTWCEISVNSIVPQNGSI